MNPEKNYGLDLRGIKKIYSDFILDITFSVQRGEFVSLVGPSGCGKTTTLSVISGLLEPDEGTMYLNRRNLLTVPIWDRAIGFVFQDYALFPHMNIERNISYGLKVKKIEKSKTISRTNTLLDTIGLCGYNKRLTDDLSGGEKQRVALARALAPNPELLLLDEPLSALDAQLRQSLRNEIRRIQKDLAVTTLYVTHDQEEALSISDRIIIMNNGSIEQIGTPEEIYSFPKTRFSAEFFGKSTLLPAIINDSDSCTCTIQHNEYTQSSMHYFQAQNTTVESAEGCFFFRPENTKIFTTSDTNSGQNSNIFPNAKVTGCEYNGTGYFIECSWKGFSLLAFSKIKLVPGSLVSVSVHGSNCLFVSDEKI
ncbi:MAG: ABC transporter ATP-binding protein [Spirochaetales bacterium]|nr:ABC transporter ATP-binding protein [Spirochaetales bacterium]